MEKKLVEMETQYRREKEELELKMMRQTKVLDYSGSAVFYYA